MLATNAGRVDLWCASPADIRDPKLFDQYQRLLAEEERSKARQFYFPHDRQSYVITRVLVREVLSKYLSLRPDQWVFAPNSYGRPMIVNEIA